MREIRFRAWDTKGPYYFGSKEAKGGRMDEGYGLAVRHCKAVVNGWTDNQTLQLKAGEMSAQEIRTVKAVLKAILRDFESMEAKSDRGS